jgi:hypothetical protein
VRRVSATGKDKSNGKRIIAIKRRVIAIKRRVMAIKREK